VSTLYGREEGGGAFDRGDVRKRRQQRLELRLLRRRRVGRRLLELDKVELEKAKVGHDLTRRVQLVRRDGRDVSTLYGREGGGAASPEKAKVGHDPVVREAVRGVVERRVAPGALRLWARAALAAGVVGLDALEELGLRILDLAEPLRPMAQERVRLVRGEGRGVST
jgi:hypothetical protein